MFGGFFVMNVFCVAWRAAEMINFDISDGHTLKNVHTTSHQPPITTIEATMHHTRGKKREQRLRPALLIQEIHDACRCKKKTPFGGWKLMETFLPLAQSARLQMTLISPMPK
jgi:hypothetical protein